MKRLYSIDLTKFIAAIGVIAIHVQAETPAARLTLILFGPIAVPFFYVSSLTFFALNLESLKFSDHIKRIFKRLVAPYLSWTFIYLSLFVLKGTMRGNFLKLVWWKVLFYGESAVHLYFLPTLIIFQVLFISLYYLFSRKNKNYALGLGLLFGYTIYMIIGNIYNCYGVSYTGSFLGSIIYVAAAYYLSPRVVQSSSSWPVVTVGFLLVTVSVWLHYLGYDLLVFDYPMVFPLGGIGLLLISFGFPNNYSSVAKKLFTLSFGIYLCHVVFLELFEFVLEKTAPGSFQYDLPANLLMILSILLCSIVFTLIVRRYSILRFLLLGESINTVKPNYALATPYIEHEPEPGRR